MINQPWGGSEELWAAMVEDALDAGMRVSVSVYRWPNEASRLSFLEEAGASILRRPLLRSQRLRRAVARIARFASPFREVFRTRSDVICISQGGTYDAVFLPDLINLLYNSSIPYVLVCHSNSESYILPPEFREVAAEFFARAAKMVFVSDRTIRLTERQLARSLPNAVVLRNPVNLSDFSVVCWPSEDSSAVKMAQVASLVVEWKGQDILFEALSSPVWKERDWLLSLYGEGPSRAYLEELARHYGIAEHVKFKGHVGDVRSIWKENHLLLVPSRQDSAPLSLVEAMLCGRPSVVTDVGGITEWVEEGKTGFVGAAPTPRSIGAALERAWQSQADWREMGERAHEVALAKIDPSPGRSLLRVVCQAIEA